MIARLKTLALDNRQALLKLVRFVIVGVVATLTYLAVSVGLAGAPLRCPEWIASAIAFAVSIPVSYLGHTYFTYSVESNHAHHGPRFILVTIGLALGLSMLSQVLYSVFGQGNVWSNVIVALLFPPLSFLAHTFWSFAPPKSKSA